MICNVCRREVDYVRASFWHGEARICRECLAEWSNPDNDLVRPGDAASVGNYVRLRHGLPPLAAALAVLLLAGTLTAHASRHCLGNAEAARTWPAQALVRDGDGCWTYDHHPPRAETPVSVSETLTPVREGTLADRWADADMIQVELRELEPERVSEAPSPEPFASASQFALFVSLVLATISVVEVATIRRADKAPRPRWPDRKTVDAGE
jgi:hypothetical protein